MRERKCARCRQKFRPVNTRQFLCPRCHRSK